MLEKKITLQRNCETVLVVKSADAQNTTIYPEYMKLKAREELMRLDPALKSDEELEAMMKQEEVENA